MMYMKGTIIKLYKLKRCRPDLVKAKIQTACAGSVGAVLINWVSPFKNAALSYRWDSRQVQANAYFHQNGLNNNRIQEYTML